MSAIPFPFSPTRMRRAGTELAALWQLAWPILIGQLANVGMSVADVAMAGHASAHDLAGISLGVSIWNITIITLMGLMMSVAPLVAHHVGAQEFDKVPHLVRQGLWKALGVGLCAMVLVNVAARVFDHMDIEPHVREVASGFVFIISFGLPAFTCYRVLYGYSASLNQTKPIMVMSLAALGLNVLVNWLLVFGVGPFPRLGGLGCAWATLLCVWLNFLGLLLWMRFAPTYRSTWPFGQWEWPHPAKLRALWKLGFPIGVTYFAETSAFGLIALLIAGFGSREVAAHQIALNFTSLVFMVPLSLGIALLTRVGQSLGAGDPVAARFRAWVGVNAGLGFGVVSAIAMALFTHQIAWAYTNDAAVAALAANLLLLAAAFQLSDSAQVVISCAIRGYKVTRSPMVIHLTAFWVFSLPLGCVLGLAPQWLPWHPVQAMGAQGFWIALVVGLTVAAVGLVLLLRKVALDHLPVQGRTA
ncbi:MATE family efflux transporter [Rhodoferax sp. TS-BS-61-7]|uniref:MATE family efflux transporter n=1 Tax=Rhodoferax sp. TS-BS-61-7 TaxID=2094194 RepID=UPI001F0114EF|nr:MATE family efflux transporter [Rhodoferax sp. TS-BS-61-7]